VFPDRQVLPVHVDSQAPPVVTALMVFPAILVLEEVKVHLVVLVVLDCLEQKDLLVTRAKKETVD
jgi:hypothetical protein